MLPDDVLLEIFDLYMFDYTDKEGCGYLESEMAMWLTLVHVCRRWRSVVFGSPRRLDLQASARSQNSCQLVGTFRHLFACQQNIDKLTSQTS